MLKTIGIIVPLLGLVLLAGGCCCVGPACDPCGYSCDPCSDTGCDVGCDSCDVSCGPPCSPCAGGCTPCCIPNPLAWVGCLFHKACCCDSGCGEIYWGSWWSDPPCCDPCDPCGNWVGGCGCNSGCDEGCYTCGGGCASGQDMPNGQCADCMRTAGVPRGTKVVEQGGERMLTPANVAPSRAPTKTSPTTVKKSPQAKRNYYPTQVQR